MKYKLFNWTILMTMSILPTCADNVTVGWKLYPLARKIFNQYEKNSGKNAPKLKPSNQFGAGRFWKGPDGTPTLGYITMNPIKLRKGHEITPLCSKGFVFYANSTNPFLDKLDHHQIPVSLLRKLYFEGTTWEELIGTPEAGRTHVTAVAPSRNFLKLIGEGTASKSRAVIKSGSSGLSEIGRNKYAFGACDLELVANEIIAKNKSFAPTIIPLRFIKLSNGNFKLVRFGTSGGRGLRLHYDQFGGIIVAGEFLRYNVVLQTPTSRKLGTELADAANQLGMEELIKFACYPLKVEFAQKKQNSRKFIFAHTMQCFLLGGIPEGFAYSYPSDIKSEDFAHWPPAPGPGTRTWWSERLSPYVHKQQQSSSRMALDSAEAAGLDAFGLLIYPGCLSEDNPWHKGLQLMIEAAQSHKVKVLFDLWGTFSPSWSKEAKELFSIEHARKLKAWMDKYPDAFLKIDGKVALCFGRDMVQFGQKASDYDKFFKTLGGRNKFYLISTLMDSRAHNVFCGWEAFGDISTMWFVHMGWGDRGLYNVLKPLLARGEKTCWGISPGYYRVGACVTEGFGACKLADDWREAIRFGAGGAYVQSWNDMGEDHHILESNFRGDTYIRINRYFADYFRTGKPPKITEEQIFIFHRRHLINAKLKIKTKPSKNPSWSSAPLSDYIHIVTMLKKPGNIALQLGSRKYTLKNVQPGFREWLLYVPINKDHKSNKPFWNEGSYERTHPEKSEFREISKLDKLESCTPEAFVIRDGKEVLKVVSRTGIAGEFPFQTYSVIGTVSKTQR